MEFNPSSNRSQICSIQRRAEPVAFFSAILAAAKTDPEITRRLAESGFAQGQLDYGLSLFNKVQAALVARQKRLGELEQAETNYEHAEATARRAYTHYCKNARLVFKDSATRIDLGLEAHMPADLCKFQIMARASYHAVACSPHLRRQLEPFVSLETAIATLDLLVEAEACRDRSCEELSRATELWDASAMELDEWASHFQEVAERTLDRHFLNSINK